MQDAAAGGAAAGEVWDEVQAERPAGMAAFAGHLAAGGHLRAGVSVEEAGDVVWLHGSVEVGELLVVRRRWDADRFGTWIGGQLAAAPLD